MATPARAYVLPAPLGGCAEPARRLKQAVVRSAQPNPVILLILVLPSLVMKNSPVRKKGPRITPHPYMCSPRKNSLRWPDEVVKSPPASFGGACRAMSSASDQPGHVTQLLERWGGGDPSALDELTPLVLSELRQLAAAYLRRERPGHTLQATALVNEAYLRLVGQKQGRWQGRKHFYGIAARLMRQVLVEHARRHGAEKRGGGREAVTLGHADEVVGSPEVDVLAVHEALERLAAFDEQHARVVELRFFCGLSIEEAAEALGVGHATVEREWALARAWLRKELR